MALACITFVTIWETEEEALSISPDVVVVIIIIILFYFIIWLFYYY